MVTLPSGSEYIGRIIHFMSWQNNHINSASSNVYDTGGTLQQNITKATAGSSADIVYDGTNWYIMNEQ